jgi:hypothetical protein
MAIKTVETVAISRPVTACSQARAHSARLESAERNVPVETTTIRARISGLIEPQAVQSDRKSL